MEVDEHEQPESNEQGEEEEVDDESEDELMKDDVEDSEEVCFDFEAYPLADGDKTGIVDMLTQIFLRADVDVVDMASALIRQSPFGCVFRPAEDFIDEDNENVVFGVVSMIALGNTQKYETDLWTLLKARAKKYADKSIVTLLDKLSGAVKEGNKVGLVLNERMLHFPSSIAGPAFSSLKDDLEAGGSAYKFDTIIMINKVRFADTANKSHPEPGNKKKKGKAAKKRAQTEKLSQADIIFDNAEEQLIYHASTLGDEEGPKYFQYPVQSDVEKESKFNTVTIKGTLYRPYRRVCFMDPHHFQRFLDAVQSPSP